MKRQPLDVPMESRMRWKSQVRFGGRRRGDHRPKGRHPAPRRRSSASRESSRPLETAGFVGEQLSRSALLFVVRTGHLGLSNLQTALALP